MKWIKRLAPILLLVFLLTSPIYAQTITTLNLGRLFISNDIRSPAKIFFDSTGGYYDFGAQVNLHSRRVDISAGHKPTVYAQVTALGDVTQAGDYKIGIKSVAADDVGVVAATRTGLIGLHAVVIPRIARTVAGFDDAVGLTIANEGTAKGTEGIYIDHNAAVAGGQDFSIGINVSCNADYGITIQGVVTTAIRIPNDRAIAGRNALGTLDLSLIKANASNQAELGSATVNVYTLGYFLSGLNVVLIADGGTGFAGAVTLGNTNDLSANSTGIGTILFKGATNRNSSGFWKIFIGVTPYYIPVFSDITG